MINQLTRMRWPVDVFIVYPSTSIYSVHVHYSRRMNADDIAVYAGQQVNEQANEHLHS